MKSGWPKSVNSGSGGLDSCGRHGTLRSPWIIDTNVHLSLCGGAREGYESLAKYFDREDDIVIEAAQIQLKYGVTTVRDSYGMLIPLTQRMASSGNE